LKFINKSILIISPEPWDHIFVSKHHYATHLASIGNKVFFLNPPSSSLECLKTSYNNLYFINYTGFKKGLRFLPVFIQRIFIRKEFNKLQKLCNVKFDVIWSFDNSVFYDFSVLPSNVYCNKSCALKGNNKLNCGYAGNLDIKYIDWEIVTKLIVDNPNVDFHFAGQWESKDRFISISSEENFHFYGKLCANELLPFYDEMNILILVYQYKKHPKQLANPHKMMEYLASGKMIISNWLDEYSTLNGELISMSKNEWGLIECFNKVTSDLDLWNSTEKISQRKQIAMESNYINKIKEIELLT